MNTENTKPQSASRQAKICEYLPSGSRQVCGKYLPTPTFLRAVGRSAGRNHPLPLRKSRLTAILALSSNPIKIIVEFN